MIEKFKRKIRKSEEEDVVLRTAVTAAVVLLVIGIIIIAVKLANPKADTAPGLKRLKQLEQTDVTKTDAAIQELEKAEKEADEEWQNRPANEKFANALVIGDSITEGLSAYGILDGNLVIAARGAEVSGIEEGDEAAKAIAKAKELKPAKLFLAYGMNDVDAVRGHSEEFAVNYKAVLDDLKEALPDTEIYVNSILPVQQAVIDKDPYYGNIPQLNKALETLCEEEKVTFIDNTNLVKQEYYTEDGIHMEPDYYKDWVNHMAEEAKL